ncbi:MAG: hypothetical protein LIR46_12845 [Bacteroidota bacterium]|nr:hypothetical protein [Bacteroidota bacterium]
MKKIIGIIIVMVVIMISIVPAMALPNYEEVMEAIQIYRNKNGIYDIFNGVIDEKDQSIYRTSGFADVDFFGKNIDVGGSWEEPERWFEKAYEKSIMNIYPEYGKVNVKMIKVSSENDVNIYKIMVTTENDAVEWIDGIQTKIEMLVSFGKYDY